MEGHVETRQRHALDDFLQMIEFGFLGFQKLAPGGRVEEQVAYFNGGAYRMRGRLHAWRHVTTFGFDLPCLIGVAGARGQGQACHGADRSQRFAAKPQAHDPLEVFQVANLAGRVACQRQRQIVRRDAAAIVTHFQQFDAGLLDVDIDAPRAGIEAVFQQLLDHRSRTLDNFARRNLVGQTRTEQFDACCVQGSLSVIGFGAVEQEIGHY